ncbi:MAG: alpha/beta hydrolase [Alphaproteobacteria bacterium]|nr:alpha/beta hydrolase [Alphaproteobacteria bacterium]
MRLFNMPRSAMFGAVLAVLTGCGSTPSAPHDDQPAATRDRLEYARTIAGGAGFLPSWSPGALPVYMQRRVQAPGQPLRVYIEGDGHTWDDPHHPSKDPTPDNPLALRLAAVDPAPNVAWLARPCQYLMMERPGTACPDRLWRNAILSREVLEILDRALDQLAWEARGAGLELVGYEGGAAAAVLLAVRRTDVRRVLTVAGSLDQRDFLRHHRTKSASLSLNPMDAASGLKGLRQVHYVGGADMVVPAAYAEAFARQVGPAAKVIMTPGAGHESGWVENWPALLRRIH